MASEIRPPLVGIITAMFIQTDKIDDYIFSLAKAKTAPSNAGYEYHELICTGFFIENRGFALTAAHVIDQLLEDFNPERRINFSNRPSINFKANDEYRKSKPMPLQMP